jgi:hypothetical protein
MRLSLSQSLEPANYPMHTPCLHTTPHQARAPATVCATSRDHVDECLCTTTPSKSSHVYETRAPQPIAPQSQASQSEPLAGARVAVVTGFGACRIVFYGPETREERAQKQGDAGKRIAAKH